MLFLQLEIKLLYFTTYHLQFDDMFKRINQILKIALKSLIFIIKNSRNWFTLTEFLQRQFNNAIIFVEILSNQVCYDFISLINVDLIKYINDEFYFVLSQAQTQNNIICKQMLIKNYYNNKHKSIHLKNETWILLRLHKKHNIFNIFVLNLKLL